MSTEALRPCAVHGHQRYMRGLFHCWGTFDGETKAIIEDQYGRITMETPCFVEFTNEDGTQPSKLKEELDTLKALIATRYNQAAVNHDKPEVAAALREIMEATR